MIARAALRHVRDVRLLVVGLAGDPVILQAGHHARAVRSDFPVEILLLKVEADVAVEVPVIDVARIAFLPRPHLATRLGVAREERGTVRRNDRRVDTERRTRSREQETVAVQHGEADASLRELGVEGRIVCALREPGAGRSPPGEGFERANAELELGANSFARGEHAREVAMGRRAREEFDAPCIPMANETSDDVALVTIPD